MYIYQFSQGSSAVKTIQPEVLPYSLKVGQHEEIEIDRQKSTVSVTCCNNQTTSSTCFNNETLLSRDGKYLLFERRAKSSKFFLGQIERQGVTTLLFTLPKKVGNSVFFDIKNVLKSVTLKSGEIYLECSEVIYMDSNSLAGMLELLQFSKSEGLNLYFYKTSDKFKSYLKLANIYKYLKIIQTSRQQLDMYLRKGEVDAVFYLELQGKKFPLEREHVVWVGRSAGGDGLQIDDRLVSRNHAALIRLANKVYIFDCNSKNKTIVNQHTLLPFKLTQLKEEDIISFPNNAAKLTIKDELVNEHRK